LITFREEKEGNRPTRRVYKITKSGTDYFKELLRQSLSEFKPLENPNVISLAYLKELPSREAQALLEDRRSELTRILDNLFADDASYGRYQLVVENQILHLSAELEWLKDVSERL
jgi:DNA-binding PadR family transcriptional regulator